METSLRFNSSTRKLRLCVKEKFQYLDGVSLTVHGELDTADGDVLASGAVRKCFYPTVSGSAATRVDLVARFGADGTTSYCAAARGRADVTPDGLWALEARLGGRVSGTALQSAWSGRQGATLGGGSTLSGQRAAKRAQASSKAAPQAFDVAAVAKAAWRAVVPEGRVELTGVLLGVNGTKQDVKLSLGYDLATKKARTRTPECAVSVILLTLLLCSHSSLSRRMRGACAPTSSPGAPSGRWLTRFDSQAALEVPRFTSTVVQTAKKTEEKEMLSARLKHGFTPPGGKLRGAANRGRSIYTV